MIASQRSLLPAVGTAELISGLDGFPVVACQGTDSPYHSGSSPRIIFRRQVRVALGPSSYLRKAKVSVGRILGAGFGLAFFAVRHVVSPIPGAGTFNMALARVGGISSTFLLVRRIMGSLGGAAPFQPLRPGFQRSDMFTVCPAVTRIVGTLASAAIRSVEVGVVAAAVKGRDWLRLAARRTRLVWWRGSVVGPLVTQRCHGAFSIP